MNTLESPPRVSAIISVYNGAEYLGDAIESLLQQSFASTEILVVNDGSTDGTAALLDGCRDPRVRVFANATNRGIARSRNVALRAARGEYIACMDADDLSLPLRFELQVRFLDERPGIAMVGTQAGTIDANGNPGAPIRLPEEPDEIARRIFEANCFVHTSLMVRRSVMLEIGGYDESMSCAIDYDLALRIAERHPVANLSEQLVDYRIHRDQLSLKRLKRQRELADESRRRAHARHMPGAGTFERPPQERGWLRRLSADEGTIAADYIAWSHRFASFGDVRTAQSFAWRAIGARPLSLRALSRALGATIERALGHERMRALRWWARKGARLIRG